jgi:hypothetical protein
MGQEIRGASISHLAQDAGGVDFQFSNPDTPSAALTPGCTCYVVPHVTTLNHGPSLVKTGVAGRAFGTEGGRRWRRRVRKRRRQNVLRDITTIVTPGYVAGVAPGVDRQEIEAFPGDTVPRWLLRDRDAIYGGAFRRRVSGIGVEEVLSSPSSPWQNPYAERLIGSMRRECLDHVIVLGERHLRRVLTAYLTYYHASRTHLALEKDAPTPRRVHHVSEGAVIAFPEVGGLHHRYERRAA